MPSDGVPQIQIRWLAEVIKRVNPCCKAVAGYSPKVVLCFPEIRQGNPRSWADDGQPFRNPVREGLPTTHPELMLVSRNPICETPE